MYSNDLDYLKGVMVDVKLGADRAKTNEIKEKAKLSSSINRVIMMDTYWRDMARYVESRIDKITMGKASVV